MTCSPATQQRTYEMFEFAAGQIEQEERERKIADGLRRRELLATTSSAREEDQRQPARNVRRVQVRARAQAER